MNCKKCGNLLNGTETVCPICGEPVNAAPTPAVNEVPQPIQPEAPTPAAPMPAPEISEPIQTPVGGPIPTPEVNEPIQPEAPAPVAPMPTPEVSEPVQPEVSNNVTPSMNTEPQPMPTPSPSIAETTPDKGKNGFKIILAILIIVALLIGGFIAYKAISKGKNNSTTPTNDNNSGTDTVNQVDTSNTYTYKNFKFNLPNGYSASETTDYLLLKGTNANVALVIYDYYTLDDIKPQADSLKSDLAAQGYTITSVDNKTYGGKEWLILSFTTTQNGQTISGTFAYTDIGEYHLAEMLIVTTPGYDAVYTELSTMFDNATYTGSSAFTPNDDKEKFSSTLKVDESALTIEE